MPPNSSDAVGVLSEDECEPLEHTSTKGVANHRVADGRKWQIVWSNVIMLTNVHSSALYGAFLVLTGAPMWQTYVFTFILFVISLLGITAGAHRLFAHKSYKANTPLKLILAALSSLAIEGSVIDWARDHRMHHKYSETDADPHNINRGFFFSHIGWVLVRKHPEIKAKGQTIDISDLTSDPVLVFQKKYYSMITLIFCILLPIIVPMHFWGESFSNAWFVPTALRITYVLNISWLVNSIAHRYGSKPYDRHIRPVDNITVAAVAFGEGYHNYHHTFPWDYKTAELGGYPINFTKAFIDTMAKIGWAYDLKSAPRDMIEKRVKRTGDGTHGVWGWGDKDLSKDEIDLATRINPRND